MRRLTRKQLTSRPDYLWPELWTKLGRNAQLKERQKWLHEKPKLDNARKLRGIYFIDPEDKEFKQTVKNAHMKLETPVAPAMPCKVSKNNQNWVTHCKSNEIKSKLVCILEASESTRMRMGESPPNSPLILVTILADHAMGFPVCSRCLHFFFRFLVVHATGLPILCYSYSHFLLMRDAM